MSRARIRKTLDRLAYASLVLDICIAVITTLSIFGEGNTKTLLIPINYLLTIVVILSVAMFGVLLLLRAKERQAQMGTPKNNSGLLRRLFPSKSLRYQYYRVGNETFRAGDSP